jgi:hypothetical protein
MSISHLIVGILVPRSSFLPVLLRKESETGDVQEGNELPNERV